LQVEEAPRFHDCSIEVELSHFSPPGIVADLLLAAGGGIVTRLATQPGLAPLAGLFDSDVAGPRAERGSKSRSIRGHSVSLEPNRSIMLLRSNRFR
jgi:hypothetical protein